MIEVNGLSVADLSDERFFEEMEKRKFTILTDEFEGELLFDSYDFAINNVFLSVKTDDVASIDTKSSSVHGKFNTYLVRYDHPVKHYFRN